MAVHPDYECDGRSRQPKEQSHQARFRGPGHSPLHMANGIRLMPTPLALSPIHPYQIAYVGGRAHLNRGRRARDIPSFHASGRDQCYRHEAADHLPCLPEIRSIDTFKLDSEVLSD
jgi:hypothetical protein